MMPSLGGGSGNGILDEIDAAHSRLSPQAQQALAQAHQLGSTGGTAPTPAAPAAPATPAQPQAPMAVPGKNSVAPLTPAAPAQQHQAELSRLTAPPMAGSNPLAHTSADTGLSGSQQIHNPFLRGLATVGDAIGTGLFPRIAMGIPGTTAHHQLLVNNATSAVHNDQQQAKEASDQEQAKAQIGLTQAQTANQEAIPERDRAKTELAQSKVDNEALSKKADTDAKLRQHGFRPDGTPLAYEEMSGEQQSASDLRYAQSEMAEAGAALRKAQAANQPQLAALAQKRLESAQQAHQIALRRLTLSEAQYNAHFYGTGADGKPLPGAVEDDQGTPIGTALAKYTAPTAKERNTGDLASSASEQIADLRSIVKKRQDIFGPLPGRKTDFTVWVGSQDPDAQRFRAARTIAGDHLAGVFGGRSKEALAGLDEAIGKFKDNPAAVDAGLAQLDKANKRFVEKGTTHTAGSSTDRNNPPPAPKEKLSSGSVPTVSTKQEFDALPKGAIYMEDGKKYKKP